MPSLRARLAIELHARKPVAADNRVLLDLIRARAAEPNVALLA